MSQFDRKIRRRDKKGKRMPANRIKIDEKEHAMLIEANAQALEAQRVLEGRQSRIQTIVDMLKIRYGLPDGQYRLKVTPDHFLEFEYDIPVEMVRSIQNDFDQPHDDLLREVFEDRRSSEGAADTHTLCGPLNSRP
jgi:hypothetical protein